MRRELGWSLVVTVTESCLCLICLLTPMKIATWNLERALPQSAKAERQRQWMNRIDADIWILTETHRAIAPGTGYHSVSSGLPDRPSEEGERWVQIWVRQDWAIAPLTTSDEARTVCVLVSLSAGQQCLVYGTVLPWLGSSWRSHPGQAFAAAVATQQADWQRLRADYRQATLIMAGDFNQDLNALHYYGSRRNKEVLRQALATAGLDCLTAGENDPVHRLINGQHSNIDHICITTNPPGQLQEVFAWPPRLEDLRGLSDHFGVGVAIAFSEPTEAT